MTQTVTAQRVREQTDDILEMVRATQQPVIVEDEGKPAIVMMSREEYDRLVAADRAEWDRLWSVVDDVRQQNADLQPAEVLSDVTAIADEVRRELNEEWRADQGGH